MNKLIITSLFCCIFAHNNFGMLSEIDEKLIICTKNRLERTQVVHNRLKIKEGNAKVIPLMIQQNLVIQRLEKFNRDMTPEEYSATEHTMTKLAQELLELERKIQSTRFKSKL